MRARARLPTTLLSASLMLPVIAQAHEIGAVMAGARSLFWNAMEKDIAQAGTALDQYLE